jgi:NAD(P)-dependent dehydrogenase (short-subunit alcohol dehydrogenase family)
MTAVFITGAARGIGLELARAYKAAGAQVLAGVRSPAQASELAATGAEIFALDVAAADSVRKLAAELQGRAIDVLINNAGVIGPDRQDALDMDFDGFLQALAINTLGPMRVTQALLPNLKAAGAARVGVISSRMGSMQLAHSSDRAAYRVSKAAVNKAVQCMATDLRPLGIAMAALHPGWVRTDMGGSNADISPQESAAGIRATLDALTLDTTGKFWNYDGKPLGW